MIYLALFFGITAFYASIETWFRTSKLEDKIEDLKADYMYLKIYIREMERANESDN